MPHPSSLPLAARFTGVILLASLATAQAATDFNADQEAWLFGSPAHRVKKWVPTDDIVTGERRSEKATGESTVDPEPADRLTTFPGAPGITGRNPVSGAVFGGGARTQTGRGVLPTPAATLPTSGTLSTTATTTPFSTAPWFITAGDGTYPDLGGVATFQEQIGTTPGTFPAVPIITLDVAVTLSGLTFNSVYQYQLAAGAGSLSLTTTGANTLSVPISNFSTPTGFAVGDLISAPIGGGGAFGLTKTGGGIVTLAGTNSYSGGTTVTGGTLRITTGDAALGATTAGNDVTLDGGGIRVSTTALTTARNFTLGNSGGVLELIAAATINGVIGGPGSLTARYGGALTLGGVSTYTGATTVQSGSSITLSNAGTLTTTSGLDLTGTLALNNGTTNVNNRVGAAVPITSRGATITLAGNATASTPTTENTGTLTLTSGNTLIAVAPGAGGVSLLAPASISRTNNATLFVRGTSLGNAAAASVAQIIPTAAPTVVGGGGAAGSTTISIVPWMVGNVSATAVTSSSLVTYTAATGLRPLNLTTEYASTLTGATAATNVRLTAAGTVPAGGAAVNSLVISSTAAAVLTSTSGGVLNINSGALLYSAASNTATTISANLNFGTAEGVIATSNSSATLTLSGVLAGSGGLTLNDFGNTALPTGTASYAITGTANTYTGTTTLLNGLTTFTGTVSNDGVTPSAFGQGTSAIVLNAGTIGLRLYSAAAGAIINRDLLVTGTAATIPTGSVGLGTVGNYALTVNGNVTLNRSLALEGGNSAAIALSINGIVSGPGYLTDSTAFSGTVAQLNGNNTYSGGTLINTGTFIAGSDTAFGTGTIITASTGTIQGNGGAARTIANAVQTSNGATNTFTFGGAAPLTFTGGINLNGNTNLTFSNTGGTTFSGVVANGSLTKAGTQILTLSNANTYTGGTVISAGSVFVTNGSGSGTGAGAVNVTGTGSLLGGSGSIVGPATTIASGAVLQGGLTGQVGPVSSTVTGVGALTLNTNLTLSSGSIIQLFLASDGSAGHGTLARAGGTWVFDTTQKFSLPGAAPSTFYDNIITGLAGDPGSEGGWTFTSAGMTGTFVYENGNIDLTLATVPEPATLLGGALTAGLLGWGMRRRLRRAA